jgi:hypothetical protein
MASQVMCSELSNLIEVSIDRGTQRGRKENEWKSRDQWQTLPPAWPVYLFHSTRSRGLQIAFQTRLNVTVASISAR